MPVRAMIYEFAETYIFRRSSKDKSQEKKWEFSQFF